MSGEGTRPLWRRKPIIKQRHTCRACCRFYHDICHARLADLFDEPPSDCPCPCIDENGQLTQQALVEMMHADPERTARLMRYREAFRLGSFDLHYRMFRFKRGGR
jgi:hypothetical protein